MKRLELKKILLILIGVVTITSCQKGNLLDEQKTLSTVKQQKFMEEISDEEFIIMTEAERQYLLESGESMTIDEFQGFLEGFLTTMIQNYPIISNGHKMILVASVIEDNVLFTGVSTDGYKISWYERIHEHFEIVRHKPTFPLEPYQPSSPEDSLVKCIYTKDINEIMMWIYLELYFEKTFCVEFDEERGYWFGCDGTCMNENCQE